MTKKEFVDEIKQELNVDDLEAQRIARAVLLTLRSQISDIEIEDIDRSLPGDIEDLWHGGWLQRFMSRMQSFREMDIEDFIEQVREATDVRTRVEAARLTKIIFHVLKEAIPPREVEHIAQDLPDELSQFWQAA